MDKEEKYLDQRFGKRTPFVVPEGYFDHFNSQMMDRLPMSDARVIQMRPTVWRRIRPAVLAAACVFAAVFSVGIYLDKAGSHDAGAIAPHASAYSPQSSYSAIDAAADYTMIDNEAIYAYVSEN